MSEETELVYLDASNVGGDPADLDGRVVPAPIGATEIHKMYRNKNYLCIRDDGRTHDHEGKQIPVFRVTGNSNYTGVG